MKVLLGSTIIFSIDFLDELIFCFVYVNGDYFFILLVLIFYSELNSSDEVDVFLLFNVIIVE